MSSDNDPISPDAVANAIAYAQELANIEKIMGKIKSEREEELFLSKQIGESTRDTLRDIFTAKEHGAAIVKAHQDEIKVLKEKVGLSELESVAADKQIAAIEKQIAATKELAGTHPDIIASLVEANDLHESIAEKIEEQDARAQNLADTTKLAAEALTGIGDSWKKSATGAFLSSVKADGFATALKNVGAGLKENFKLENIAGSVMMGFVQQTAMAVVALDGARSGFAKAMGTGDSYNSTISEVHLSTREYGVDASEAAAATQALAEGMAGFGQMSKTAKADLAGFVAVMGELGVSGADGAKMLENTTKVMGMTKGESKALGADLSALASDLNISLSGVMGDFNAVMGDLAIYGKEAPNVFKKMVGASTVLGLSVDDLVGSMKDLDTVTGAATRAGKMNAVLGGQFMDTNALLNASYEERILLTKQGLDASGKDFDSMSRAEKQMLAQASGMKDVGELAKYMRSDMNELTASMDKAGEASGSIEEMQERAEQAQSITDKWKQTMESLAIATEPLLDALHFFVDIIKTIIQLPGANYLMLLAGAFYFLGSGAAAAAWGGLTAFGTAIWGGITAVGTMIAKMAIWTAGKIAGLGWTWAEISASYAQKEATEELTEAQEEQAAAADKPMGGGFLKFLKKLGEDGKKAIPVLFALGFVFLAMGLAIFMAAYGVAEFVRSFAGFSAGEILAISLALLVFGAMIVGLAIVLAGLVTSGALPVAVGGLYAFGVVMIMLGIAIWIAAHAFGVFVGAILLLLPHAEALLNVSGALLLLAIAGMLMLPGGMMALAGLTAMALGLAALALALAFISTEDLNALGNMMMGLGTLAGTAGGGLADAAPAVEALMDALLDASPAIETLMDTLSEATTTIGSSIWLFVMLGNTFLVLAAAAEIAGLYLPVVAISLMTIALATTMWAAAMIQLLPTLPIFFSYIPQWYEILFIFSMLAPAIFTLALATTILAMTGIAAAIGLMFLALGFWYLSAALNSLPVEAMTQFHNMLDKIESTTDAAIDRIYSLASAVWVLAWAMGSLNTSKMFTLGYTLEQIGYASEEASNLTPNAVDNVVGLVTAAEEYSSIRYSFATFAYGDPFTDMLDAATKSSAAKTKEAAASSGGGDQGPSVVILQLDGRELGRTVQKLLGKRNNLKAMI